MIRPASYSDVPEIIDLVIEFFGHGELDGTGLVPDSDTIEFLAYDMIDMPTHTIMVADEGGITGAIAGAIQPWMFNHDIKTLIEFGWFIKPGHRGGATAFSLLKSLRRWGKEQGATTMVLSSTKRAESPRVVKFYENIGLRHLDSNFVGRL